MLTRYAMLGLVLGSVLAVGGCSCECPREPVEIVAVEPNTGWTSGSTVVEFPDGERIRRPGVWGERGDEFKARRYSGFLMPDSWE